MLISWKMHSKYNIGQKNVKLILLIYSYDSLSIKIICHTCYIEKYGHLIYVQLFAISCKIVRGKNVYKTYIYETFCTVIVDFVDHGKNSKSVV
jgi:hypothetical protein